MILTALKTKARLLRSCSAEVNSALVLRPFRKLGTSAGLTFRTALASECPRLVGSTVKLAGWVQSIRAMGGVTFILLRDSYDTVQLTINSGASIYDCTLLARLLW